MSEASAAPIVIVVEAADAGRVDHVVGKRFPDATRSRIAALFDDGAVRVRGRVAKKGDRVAAGDTVTVARAPVTDADLRVAADADAAARLDVLYEDETVVVVAKPAGMPSQPLEAGERGTAANGIVHRWPECATVADDPRDGGLVHRLDAGTSGALIAARTRAAWQQLRAAFGTGQVTKEYLALVEAPPVSRECDAPLVQRGKRAVVDLVDGLRAHTSWTEVSRHGPGGEQRLLRCHAVTGRTHQVRAHLAHCGAPIVGDELYGSHPRPGLDGFFLHASRVTFPSPSTGEAITIDAPLPPDRQGCL